MKLRNKCSVIATSHYCGNDLSRIQKNIDKMGFLNFEYLISKEKYFGKWAGNPSERLNLLHKAILSNSNAIVAAKGGSGITHFIKDVDYSLFSKNKKMLIGYSNLTPLINLINQKANIISLYGPTAFQELDYDSLLALKKAFSMENYFIPFNEKNVLNINKNKILGKTVAGNLRTFVKSITLHLGIDFTDKIVFIEDKKVVGEVGEVKDFQAYNFFLFLKNYSLFKPRALVFGGIGIERNKKLKEMLEELFPNIPIIFGIPFGHQLPNITIPVGVNCILDFSKNEIQFNFQESEKGYAVNFNVGSKMFSERFYKMCLDPKMSKNYWPKSQKKKSIESIMKIYIPKNFQKAERFRISGLRNKGILQLSSPFWDGNKKYMIAEIEGDNSALPKSVFLKKEKNSWTLDESIFDFGLSDVKVFTISGRIILIGKNNKKIIVYSGGLIHNMTKIQEYSSEIQEVVFVNTGDKIGIFFKKNNKISYTDANNLRELSEYNLSHSKIILDFALGEWGNISQAILLKNGKIGVLGYIARKTKYGSYFSYPFVFCFNPFTNETTSIRILIKRGELPDGDSKAPNLYNVLLPGGIIRKEKLALLYLSVGELEGYKVEIKDPFTYYEKKF